MLRGGLGVALQRTAANYAIPVCWIRADGGKPKIEDNGSAFMLDCGAGPFLVTAAHVYLGFLAARDRYPDLVCFLGTHRFELEKKLISIDVAHDVATLRVAEADRIALRTYEKFPLTGSQRTWPPSPPMVGRGVFFVGFPGDGRSLRPRRMRDLVEIDWTGYTALAIADGVSDAAVTVILEHDPSFDVFARPEIPEDWALGGCSGAPLLTFVDDKGLFSWRLGGVITEASKTIVRAARADCLNSDGTLNAHPDPMAYRPKRASPE
jgi:hypothetical protein